MITVITHNGKMPADGGIRLGYVWHDEVRGTMGAYPQSLLRPVEKPAPPVARITVHLDID
jgi:hypothetical protein